MEKQFGCFIIQRQKVHFVYDHTFIFRKEFEWLFQSNRTRFNGSIMSRFRVGWKLITESVIELILLGRYFGYFHCLLDRSRIKLSNSIKWDSTRFIFFFHANESMTFIKILLLLYPNKKPLNEELFAQIGSLRILYLCS